jgi:CMP-N,N'-diacetyllegionaminic acid synthase
MARNSGINVALIPARAGSKRLPFKNVKLLNGAPLIAYTIISAIQADVFTEIVVSTDSPEIADIAQEWGAKVPKLRPEEFATDSSSDIEWVRHAVSELVSIPPHSVDKVSILRPTNPLRKSSSIVEAMEKLDDCTWADSIRAMERTDKHPGKMWILDENKHALPFLDQSSEAIPTFNRPTQTLQKLWVQNASLEIAKLSSIIRTQKISGDKVIGIELPSFEGFDINTQLDWDLLEFLVSRNPDLLPKL